MAQIVGNVAERLAQLARTGRDQRPAAGLAGHAVENVPQRVATMKVELTVQVPAQADDEEHHLAAQRLVQRLLQGVQSAWLETVRRFVPTVG